MHRMVYVLLLLSLYGTESKSISQIQQTSAERELFETFKRNYTKRYSEEEHQRRFEIFKENLQTAALYQKQERGTAKYGVTKFFDLTAEEFKQMYLSSLINIADEETVRLPVTKLGQIPSSFDWRSYGAVGPVLEQGRCGACWAFSVVENIEGQWFMKTHKLLGLSIQELIDCDYSDNGCNGGYPPYGYRAVQSLGGLELAVDYPYVAHREACSLEPKKLVAYVNGSVILPKDPEYIAEYLCIYGPLSVVLNAGLLQYYTSGVLHPPYASCNPQSLNHAVLSVGLGVEQDNPYWIVKNSWGPNWGEQGYFRIYRGDNTCGMDELVTSATVGFGK